MLTKKQVFEAALKYAQEQSKKIEDLQAENAVLRANLDAAIKPDQFDQYRDEVAKAVKVLRAENERLAAAIEGAVTDLLAGASRHAVRERLQKALEQ